MKTALLALLLTVAAARANEDLPVDWRSITIGFGAAKSNDSVCVITRGEDLSKVSACWHGKTFAVPVAEFQATPRPQIKSIDIRQGEFSGDGGVPYLVVEMQYGSPSFGEHPRVQFLFYSGSYQGMTLRKRTAEDQWQHSEKHAGKPPTIKGIETFIGHLKTAPDVNK